MTHRLRIAKGRCMKKYIINSFVFFILFTIGQIGLDINLASKKGVLLFVLVVGSAVSGVLMNKYADE